MALLPIHGRAVWARSPSKPALATSTPWHPASTQPSVGSSSTAKSPASSSGCSREDDAEPVELVGDLLALVEHEGHVVGARRVRGCGVQLLGEAQQHREAALHVGRAEAVQRCRRRPRGTSLPLAGTVSRWPPSTTRRSRPSCVRTTMLCADAVDRERRRTLDAAAPRRGRRARPRGGSPTAPRTSAAVSPKRSAASMSRTALTSSRRDAVVAQDVVELRPCRGARPR